MVAAQGPVAAVASARALLGGRGALATLGAAVALKQAPPTQRPLHQHVAEHESITGGVTVRLLGPAGQKQLERQLQQARARIDERAKKKPAIVLAHGLVHPLGAATDKLLKRSYFAGIPEYLRSKGFRVLDPRVSNMGHVHDRAQQLRERIADWDELEAGERVVLIGHSMGGLDARWMVSQLDGAELVESVVTIGTPHHGCCVADTVMENLSPISDFAERLNRIGVSLRAVECLTTSFMRDEFNAVCRDSPDVKYYSVSGQTLDSGPASPSLWPSHRLVSRVEGPNDGMVSVESSKHGVHLGTFPVDHLEQIAAASAQLYESLLTSVLGDEDTDQPQTASPGLGL